MMSVTTHDKRTGPKKMINSILYPDAKCVQFGDKSRGGDFDADEMARTANWIENPLGNELERHSANVGEVQQHHAGPSCDWPPLVLTYAPYLPKVHYIEEYFRRKKIILACHARRGQGGMSPKAQSIVKRRAAALEYFHRKKDLAFLTVTLDDTYAPLIQGDVIARMTKNLRDIFVEGMTQRGLPPLLVGVVEIQPQRLAETGKVCYHWHFVLPARTGPGPWALTTHEWNDMVGHALRRTLPDMASHKMRGWVDIEPIRKSAAAYLGKYMTKGHGMVELALQADPDHVFPKQWWTCTRTLKHLAESLEVEIEPSKSLEFIESIRRDMPEQILWEHDKYYTRDSWEWFGPESTDAACFQESIFVAHIIGFRDYATVANYIYDNNFNKVHAQTNKGSLAERARKPRDKCVTDVLHSALVMRSQGGEMCESSAPLIEPTKAQVLEELRRYANSGLPAI